MKAIEWDYSEGFIRRLRIILNEGIGNEVPCFGESKKSPLPNRFEFPDDV
jgi:hypothetical protein